MLSWMTTPLRGTLQEQHTQRKKEEGERKEVVEGALVISGFRQVAAKKSRDGGVAAVPGKRVPLARFWGEICLQVVLQVNPKSVCALICLDLVGVLFHAVSL